MSERLRDPSDPLSVVLGDERAWDLEPRDQRYDGSGDEPSLAWSVEL